MNNTKTNGNKAEMVIMAEFVKNNIPISLPFGDNQPYDIVIQTKYGFKSVQVKYASLKNGAIWCDIRKRVGCKRIEYVTYDDYVDYIAVWCEEINSCYLLSIEECNHKTYLTLRIEPPKINFKDHRVIWAKDYEFYKIVKPLIPD